MQSPALPLGHAAKTIQNRCKFSPFGLNYWTSFFYCTCILNPVFLNPPPKGNPYFFWLDWIRLFNWLYSISKHTMPKNFPSLFSWKIECGFSVTKVQIQQKIEPLTIGCWLKIHEQFLDLNLKLCFPNDIRKSKLIHN